MKVLLYVGDGIGNCVHVFPCIESIRQAGHDLTVCVISTWPGAETLVDHPKVTVSAPEASEFDALWASPTLQLLTVGGIRPFATIPTCPVSLQEISEVDACMWIARQLGYGGETPAGRPRVTGANPGQGAVVIAPGVQKRWEAKRYPHWNRVAELLKQQGIVPTVIGTADDPAVEGAYDLRGTTTCQEMAVTLASAKCVVGPDNGPTAIAAACGTPTIVLWGPTHRVKNFKHGPNVRNLMATDMPCRPCQFTGQLGECREAKCMAAIEPETVAAEILRAIGVEGQKPAPVAERPSQWPEWEPPVESDPASDALVNEDWRKNIPLLRSLAGKPAVDILEAQEIRKLLSSRYPAEAHPDEECSPAAQVVGPAYREHPNIIPNAESGQYGLLSLRWILDAAQIVARECSGPERIRQALAGCKVLEIGSGLGGLYRALTCASPGIAEYVMLDHPAMLALAQSFIAELPAPMMIPLSERGRAAGRDTDLVIASRVLSESTPEMLDWLIASVLPHTQTLHVIDTVSFCRKFQDRLPAPDWKIETEERKNGIPNEMYLCAKRIAKVPPVVVMGAGRCGTNLTTELLRAAGPFHTEIWAEDPTTLLMPRLHPGFLTKVDSQYATAEQVMAFVKRTGAKIVWVLRDPRDAALSKMARGLENGAEDGTLEGAVADLQHAADVLDAILPVVQPYVVRMRELQADPELVARELCKWLGVEYRDVTGFWRGMRNDTYTAEYTTLDPGRVATWKRWPDVYKGALAGIDAPALFARLKPLAEHWGYADE